MPKETTATYPCPHQQYYPWGEEKFGSSPNDRVKFATYRRDSESLLDYAWNRYYDNTTGRFLTPDSYKGSADPYNPQSWNRYAYGLNDPVGHADPTGLFAPPPGLACAPWDASCNIPGNDACSSTLPGADSFAPGIPTPGDGGPSCQAGPTSGPPLAPVDCGVEFFSIFGLVSGGEIDAVSVILGENSWIFLGKRQYLPGQTYGHGTGPLITVSDVAIEDAYMADVILNRVSQWGGSISSRAANISAFNGYAAGLAEFTADMSKPTDSTDCSDLLVAFAALRAQETIGRLNLKILYWGAVVDPKTNIAIAVPPGDFMVADTIFGAQLVYQ